MIVQNKQVTIWSELPRVIDVNESARERFWRLNKDEDIQLLIYFKFILNLY